MPVVQPAQLAHPFSSLPFLSCAALVSLLVSFRCKQQLVERRIDTVQRKRMKARPDFGGLGTVPGCLRVQRRGDCEFPPVSVGMGLMR